MCSKALNSSSRLPELTTEEGTALQPIPTIECCSQNGMQRPPLPNFTAHTLPAIDHAPGSEMHFMRGGATPLADQPSGLRTYAQECPSRISPTGIGIEMEVSSRMKKTCDLKELLLQPLLHQEQNQILYPARITPLIVVPANHLAGIPHHLRQLAIEDAR